MQAGDRLLSDHYAHHADKPFFASLADFMKSSPLVAMVWEGRDAVEAVRLLAGSTNARQADAGTIRGDLGMSFQNNLIHASDSAANAQAEVERFFNKEELFKYDKSEYLHLYAEDEL
jgi:nucleoside-diphosphate kinase